MRCDAMLHGGSQTREFTHCVTVKMRRTTGGEAARVTAAAPGAAAGTAPTRTHPLAARVAGGLVLQGLLMVVTLHRGQVSKGPFCVEQCSPVSLECATCHAVPRRQPASSHAAYSSADTRLYTHTLHTTCHHINTCHMLQVPTPQSMSPRCFSR